MTGRELDRQSTASRYNGEGRKRRERGGDAFGQPIASVAKPNARVSISRFKGTRSQYELS